ncbi:MAG: ATP-binding protein, partial [Actinomycetota bacterium]|nr:ATP-binding protein [Actinomycetota bacterium]
MSDELFTTSPDGTAGAGAGSASAVPVEQDKTERKSASTLLVEIAEELYEFGVSDAGDTFGVPRSGPKVVRLLRGGKTSLRGQLAREFFLRAGKAAPQQALADALLVIEGVAQDSEERQLALRVAQHDGATWLDLGDATGRAVRITSTGWQVMDAAPVLFRRTALNAALPVPVPGGKLSELWGWLNVAPEDRPLLAASLVAMLMPEIPHPVIGLFGEQGTGKSTAAKVVTLLLDPSPVPLRKPPRDADSWVTAAAGSWVVGIDNLSEIPAWFSDSMCRAVTGDGDVRRRLYTDGDLAVFSFRRCLVINGIDVGAVRGDLAERMLPINLHTIAERDRREESKLWPAWELVHPRLLGAVLDLAAGVTGVLPSVRLDRMPRMADFARILAAVDIVLGTHGLQRFLTKQGETAVDS